MEGRSVTIGFDQSYKNFGYAICIEGKIVTASCKDLTIFRNNTERRFAVQELIAKLFYKLQALGYKGDEDIIVVVERLRQFSAGFISMAYIKSTSALISTVIDTSRQFEVDTYSVDTRAWKKAILGTCKSDEKMDGVIAKKEATVRKVIELGFENKIRYIEQKGKNKGKVKYNDDIADAICIALYGAIDSEEMKLKLENF